MCKALTLTDMSLLDVAQADFELDFSSHMFDFPNLL